MEEDRLTGALERIADVMEEQREEERRRQNALRDGLAALRLKSALCEQLRAAMDAAVEEAGGLPREFDAERTYSSMCSLESSDELVEYLQRSFDYMRRLVGEYRNCDPAMPGRVMGAAARAAAECLEKIERELAERGVDVSLSGTIPYAVERPAPEVLSQVKEHFDALFEVEERLFQKFRRVLEVGGIFSAFSAEPSCEEEMDLASVIEELERAVELPFFGPFDDPTPIVEAFWHGWSELARAVACLCPLPRATLERYELSVCDHLDAAMRGEG